MELSKYAQGGIVATNVIFKDFNVTPIQVVTVISNLKRDNNRAPQQIIYKKVGTNFAGELEKVMEEPQTTTTNNVTNSLDSQFQPFLYSLHRDL